jgi:GAF domain-containing protein
MSGSAPPRADGETRARALDALGILDTPPEPEFDDIASLASLVCEAPAALVSLVDDGRQWFKARVGFEACETGLDRSVCAHALTDPAPGVFIVRDLTADPRTRENPMVTGEPHLRFYAGVRLVQADGLGVGLLCVLDHRPRPEGLSEAQARRCWRSQTRL